MEDKEGEMIETILNPNPQIFAVILEFIEKMEKKYQMLGQEKWLNTVDQENSIRTLV